MVKARKIAAKGGRIAGSGAGGFLTGILGSPAGLGAIGIVTILAVIFIFREQIGKALGGIGENFGKVELPDINLPSFEFPDITFPTFEFPDITFPDFNIDFPDFFGGAGEAIGGAGEAAGDFFSGLQDQFNNFISGITPKQPLTEADQFDFSGLAGGVSPKPTGQTPPPFSDAAIFAKDFPEMFMEVPDKVQIGKGVPSPFQDQQFTGGGVSFEGGQIFESKPTLSSIIDEFGVTASQAANILANINQDFGDFDFGTNTGSGIGSVTGLPQIQELIPSPNVSDQQFAGLSAEEIFAQLVGGNINKF